MRIGLIRVDFIPERRIKNLCLPSVRKYLDISKNSCVIKHPDYTIRFTSSLCISVFIKKRFAIILSQLGRIIFQLCELLNRFKVTPVTKFQNIRITNIQGTGYLSSEIYNTFNTIQISEEYSCFAGSSGEPSIRFHGCVPRQSQFYTVEISEGSHVKFCRNGYYSIIAKNVDDFLSLVQFIKTQT